MALCILQYETDGKLPALAKFASLLGYLTEKSVITSSVIDKMLLYSEIVSKIKHNSRKANNRPNKLLPSHFGKTQ